MSIGLLGLLLATGLPTPSPEPLLQSTTPASLTGPDRDIPSQASIDDTKLGTPEAIGSGSAAQHTSDDHDPSRYPLASIPSQAPGPTQPELDNPRGLFEHSTVKTHHWHFLEPAGCRPPIEDLSLIEVEGRSFSARTVDMLKHAQRLYGGSLDVLSGSSVWSEQRRKFRQSADARLQPGVVKLSVTESGDMQIPYGEVDRLIRALRAAGFAAWMREKDELYDGSPTHLHAIAIGDRHLSAQAIEQLIGEHGYFRGLNGLPSSPAIPDPHGGPILCGWMIDMGYANTQGRNPTQSPSPPATWQAALTDAANSFITHSVAETDQLAKSLGFLGTGYEDPSNMCGPLSGAILAKAGLLPWSVGPMTRLSNYWLADPEANGRPWSLFPESQYDLHRFQVGIDSFDFSAWPLRPGDFVYAYAGNGGFSHMFVVTEVDELGRSYTVTNMMQPEGTYLVQRVLLYDPANPEEGILRRRCSACVTWWRRTGLAGFGVLRRKDLGLPAGAEYLYQIEPGDTILRIARKFGTTVDVILKANRVEDGLQLAVGASLIIHVNIALRPNHIAWDSEIEPKKQVRTLDPLDLLSRDS